MRSLNLATPTSCVKNNEAGFGFNVGYFKVTWQLPQLLIVKEGFHNICLLLIAGFGVNVDPVSQDLLEYIRTGSINHNNLPLLIYYKLS